MTPSLFETALAYLDIRGNFLDDDLREQLGAAHHEFRQRVPSVAWHSRRSGHVGIIAAELCKLTGDSYDDCLAAVKQAAGADWTSIARREIVEYAQRLSAGRRSA